MSELTEGPCRGPRQHPVGPAALSVNILQVTAVTPWASHMQPRASGSTVHQGLLYIRGGPTRQGRSAPCSGPYSSSCWPPGRHTLPG
jgi:hypothetical protein